MSVAESKELRSLTVDQQNKLKEKLDLNDAWKKLAAIIMNPDKRDQALYTSAHLNTFESNGRRNGEGPASLLWKDWVSRGRVRPTVKCLYDYLIQAKLYHASDYVLNEILQLATVQRLQPPNNLTKVTPVGEIPDDDTNLSSLSSKMSILREPDQESNTDDVCGITHFSYARLLECTRGFSISVGEGAFGEVYWGDLMMADGIRLAVAVKKLTLDARDQFLTELRVMTEYKHQNLLPLIGYSNDNLTTCCLITPFMTNGSLEDRLSQKNATPPLSWKIRLNVAVGTARGLVHLHTHGKEALVHRDVKSANILLDENFEAKVGDFGIVRIGGDWQKTTNVMTNRISGTRAYMSKDAFNGIVTVKMDTFSFGIVLLELLTGLAPDDPCRNEWRNLLSYVKESRDKTAQNWKDPNAGDWPDSVVVKILEVALRSTKGSYKKRLLMQEVLQELEKI